MVECSISPPSKANWHSENILDRQPWSNYYEAIANWFCLSNSIRKERNCIIIIEDRFIEIIGEEVRYLSPNFRSIAPLILKASNLEINEVEKKESTPGIYAGYLSHISIPQPVFCLHNDTLSFDVIPNRGTISTNPAQGTDNLSVPATNISQAIIWLNFG